MCTALCTNTSSHQSRSGFKLTTSAQGGMVTTPCWHGAAATHLIWKLFPMLKISGENFCGQISLVTIPHKRLSENKRTMGTRTMHRAEKDRKARIHKRAKWYATQLAIALNRFKFGD